MKIEEQIFKYCALRGTGDAKEIAVPQLDAYLVANGERTYVGGKLIEALSGLIDQGLITKTTGSKVSLTEKGMGKVNQDRQE
jgi:hypothetical protein